MNFAKNLAKSRNGDCLSKKYKSTNSYLLWKCNAHNFKWKAKLDSVKKGQWCPKCFADKYRLDPAEIISAANKMGGKCLSTKNYKTVKTKLQFECAQGHKFWMQVRYVRSGSWCPECSSGKSERICRAYFEQLFGHSFPKTRPKWLKGLELDGYCHELKLAFEHNGIQHYKKIFGSQKNNEHSIKYRKKKDALKKQLCKKHGVQLIIIPALFVKTKLKDLKIYIKRKYVGDLPENFDSKNIDLKCVYEFNSRQDYLNKTILAAKKFSGRINNENDFIIATHKILFTCDIHNESFLLKPERLVNRNVWPCKYCKTNRIRSKLNKLSALDIDKIIKLRASGLTFKNIALAIGSNYATISMVINGKYNYKPI